MNTFDWLSNMELPGQSYFDIVEVKFKGGRKEFFKNDQQLNLVTGDAVVVEMVNGYHLGYVSLQGELVHLQMNRKKTLPEDVTRQIFRVANEKDHEKFEQVKKRELPTMFRTREIIQQLGLKMKLSDVEFQADNTKATFYYSADERVDFRELIKLIAGEFKIRVEMRQISLRQEASRLGGIGSCGRELCCSTWLTDFKSVSTGAARYQNLSLNPSKLSGQCGRLKCCLNYELETYLDALIDIPKVDHMIPTVKGNAYLQKVDIFKKIMWFSYDSDTNWFSIEAEKLKPLLENFRKGTKLDLQSLSIAPMPSLEPENPSMSDDIARLDNKLNAATKKKKKKKPKNKQKGPKNNVPPNQPNSN
jgi:cell fate regulator YaaT (PSP1 superfamily)